MTTVKTMHQRGSSPPKGWPSDVQYLGTPIPSALLPRHLIARYCTPWPSPPAQAHVRIRVITQPASHPAFGQRGLFATRALPPGTDVTYYTGVVHTESESVATSAYDLALERREEVMTRSLISMDASQGGGVARFVNDFRGVRDRPNCEFELITKTMPPSGGVEGVRMAIRTLTEVRKGDELCVTYGKGFWAAERTLAFG